jgi:hypothetical protein
VISPERPEAPSLPRIARGADAQALAFEEFREKLADFAIIVDDQDMRLRVHDAPSLARFAPLCAGLL